LLERLREHTEYLRTLASKLSHELRTPLAVVTTSLDNLEHERNAPEAEEYLKRLRHGTERLDGILAAMSEVPDPRRAAGKRYPLAPLLLFTVLALLSGATSYRHIICFLEQRRLVLNALFGCTLKRAPSLNTLRTVLQTLDRDALEDAFRQHARGLLPPAELSRMPVVALDGKTLKGSFDHLNDQKAAQALSAFASDAAILLAHSEIDIKSNEIPAAQQMIAELGLTGVLFTADAVHCQKNL